MKNNSYNSLQEVVSEVGQSRTVRLAGDWILVFRSSTPDPDAITDLKKALNGLDIEDIRYITSMLLVGERKSVRVDSNLVEDLVGDRSRSTAIINEMKEELDRDFGHNIYNRGPHRRLAIRIPINEMEEFVDEFTPRIRNIILNEREITPYNFGDILSVYLIADDSYVRLEPHVFFQEIYGMEMEAEAPAIVPDAPRPGRIILGVSAQELVELALKKLKGYVIYRNIRFTEAAGLAHFFDAFAIRNDDRVLLKYMDYINYDDIKDMELYVGMVNASQGWLLTKNRQPGIVNRVGNISILTIEDL